MKKKVSIIGGGTAGLFLASFIDTNLYDVTFYEKMKSLGRKFLVAGDGGFNLSHSEDMERFKKRYTPSGFLDEALDHFTNDDFRNWLDSIGIPTIIGSSKRVYPERGIKPISVLKQIETHLRQRGVKICFGKTFSGWEAHNRLTFDSNEVMESDISIFCLGGASWKVTGSDGTWLAGFGNQGIETHDFSSANCAFKIEWPREFFLKHAGSPLKNITVSAGDRTQKGEAVITQFGIEGNAVYALSPEIQASLQTDKMAMIHVDFKPMLSYEIVAEKLNNSALKTTEKLKKVLKLSANEIDLIKGFLSKDEYLDTAVLCRTIKAFPLWIVAAAPIDEAISTTGGIGLSAIDSTFEIRGLKNNYCIGEMLDWNAPTGGYLIQACASMGVYLAHVLNQKAN